MIEIEVLVYTAHGRTRRAEGAFRHEGSLKGTFQVSGGMWFYTLEPLFRMAPGLTLTVYSQPLPEGQPEDTASRSLLARLHAAKERRVFREKV